MALSNEKLSTICSSTPSVLPSTNVLWSTTTTNLIDLLHCKTTNTPIQKINNTNQKRHKPNSNTKKGRKTRQKKLKILHSNANGLQSKKNSLFELVESNDIDIIALTERKCTREGLINIPNFDTPYELIRQSKKDGGLLVACHQTINDNCLIEKGNDDAEFITIQFNNDKFEWRMILGYGFQESDSKEKRTRFFIDIESQIEKCIIDGISFLWIGDCNGKLGRDVMEGDTNDGTPNGQLIKQIINKHNLIIVNGSEKCNGKWTRWLENGQKSVIDYVIVSEDMYEFVNSMLKNEEK